LLGAWKPHLRFFLVSFVEKMFPRERGLSPLALESTTSLIPLLVAERRNPKVLVMNLGWFGNVIQIENNFTGVLLSRF
jgi:hypothetical protein